MELLYHYQSHTSLTLGDTSMWRDKVPRLAFRHHCILHLILAMAALHQIRIHPASAARFEERANAHLDVGTRQATTLLPSLDESNCTMLYVATVLICSCTFAKGPGPGHLLVIAEGDEVAWWELFRGVRIVVDRIGIAAIFSGELGPLPSDDTEQSSITGRIDFDYIEWEDAVRLLSELVAQASEESMGPCQQAVSVMTWCYKHTFGISVNAKRHVEGRFERVMTWLYFLPDEFVSGLKTLEPAPLVILAYFTPLLQLLEGFWYMRGWAAHVLHGINGILPPAYGQWLQWPNEAVRLGQRCIEESDRGTKSRDLQHIIPTVN
ncbi:hypothetical protein GQ53DRAFT_743955 [Thozetella sp. PMI_491]|nr:hypothetical protein GQ53DRAFT_743955 [Thozetella sp. PMI_491]